MLSKHTAETLELMGEEIGLLSAGNPELMGSMLSEAIKKLRARAKGAKLNVSLTSKETSSPSQVSPSGSGSFDFTSPQVLIPVGIGAAVLIGAVVILKKKRGRK